MAVTWETCHQERLTITPPSVPLAGAHPPLPQEATDAAHRELQHTAGTGLRRASARQMGPLLVRSLQPWLL